MAGVIPGLELFDRDSLVNGALDKSLVIKSLNNDAFFKPNSPIRWYLEGVDRISLVNDLVKSGEIPEEFEDAIRELVILQAHHDHINKRIEEVKEKSFMDSSESENENNTSSSFGSGFYKLFF